MNSASRFFGLVLVPFITFVLGISVPSQGQEAEIESQKVAELTSSSDAPAAINKLKEQGVNFALLSEMLYQIEAKYVDPDQLSAADLSNGLAKGLVYSLDDQHSVYLTPEENSDFLKSLERDDFFGIGAELTMQRGNITVVSPLKSSPAMAAGIMPQDIIVKVNSEDITDLSLNQVVQKIRGEKGTKVTLTIARVGEDDFLDIEITRDEISVESVTLDFQDNIAILEVSKFGSETTEEFEKYLSEAILKEPDGIILDFRYNGGGYFDKAQDMVSFFVNDGLVATSKSRKGTSETKVIEGQKKTELPLVVVQNGGSASASEIVAGALKDHERATILGETSFGKGSVQEVIKLKSGGSVKLTIAKWFTPKGYSIEEEGITPDYIIKNTTQDRIDGKDPQLEAAIKLLKGESIDEYLETAEDLL
jgi:carboxyl-terminal processing protease